MEANGFDRRQVQAIFFKASTGGPRCDLSGFHCLGTIEADAYTSERYLGNILRYLKLGYQGRPVRFPNLRQVFLTSRIYGGYAQVEAHNACNLNPEPYAYELAFGVQRLIVAQINQEGNNTIPIDPYAGVVDYDNAPWFDWGPYLWANGDRKRSDDLVWCSGQIQGFCAGQRDFRFGDLNPLYEDEFWGDLTHPAADGAKKVANQLVRFIGKEPNKPGSAFVTPWIDK